MKKYMTVYDMIKTLAKFPADMCIEFRVWATKDQINTYVDDVKDDDHVMFMAQQMDDADIHFNNPKNLVIIEMDVDDL